MSDAASTFCVGDVVELLFQYRIRNGNIYDDRALQRGIVIYVDDAWEAYDVMWTDGTVTRNMFLDETTTECIVRAKGTSRASTAQRTLRPRAASDWILSISGSTLT